MAAVEVPQTLEYRGDQINAAPVLEVENFTNWKKRFMCHIIGIEPQFENIIKNGPFIPMIAGQRKPENQLTRDERKAANLDQRLKSLIMFVLLDDQMNSVINFLTAKLTWDDLILYHEGPFDVKESRVMDLKLCYNTFKFKEGESLTQTFTRYKALMNELVNDGIKLSKLEINTGFINGLPKKWLSFCQSLRNTNNVKDSELASLFGKLKYEENLIDNIYKTEKNKCLVSVTPLSTAFFSSSIVQDSQDSLDDEEDTRSSHEYLNDLEEEYQPRALLVKSKRFFKKGTQRVLMALAEENDAVNKEEDNNDRKVCLDYLCTDLNYVEEQRNKSSVCSTLLPPLKKLDGAEPISGPKTIKLILRSKSTFKAEALKGVIINEPSSAPTKDNKSSSASKVHSAPAACSSPNHTTTDHNDIEWFKRGEALQAKKAKALKSTRAKSSNANRSKTPTKRKPIWYMDSGCSRHMTGVKSYLHKYVEQPGPKVVFGDDSTCTIEGYGSIKCNGIVFIKFDEKRGTIFNSNKEIIMIAPRVRDVYVLDMTSSAQESFYIHNHKDHLGKFDKKADDGYLLGYSLVSKAFRVFNTRRQQTKETYHITFDESPKAIKFLKPSTMLNQKDIHLMNIFILMNLIKAPQDRWSQDKHIELVNIIGNLGAGMLTRAMAKQLSAASAYECLFLDFLSKKEPKRVSEALKHPGWVDAMQDKLN
ncbi:retrovirus-related pol polyprotein from transposon TNT 1-94 [Tanacetum coccineum]